MNPLYLGVHSRMLLQGIAHTTVEEHIEYTVGRGSTRVLLQGIASPKSGFLHTLYLSSEPYLDLLVCSLLPTNK